MAIKSRTEEIRTLIKEVHDGEFDYNSRESPKTNWNLYDNAQIKELANYLDNLRDLVDEADKRIKERYLFSYFWYRVDPPLAEVRPTVTDKFPIFSYLMDKPGRIFSRVSGVGMRRLRAVVTLFLVPAKRIQMHNDSITNRRREIGGIGCDELVGGWGVITKPKRRK